MTKKRKRHSEGSAAAGPAAPVTNESTPQKRAAKPNASAAEPNSTAAAATADDREHDVEMEDAASSSSSSPPPPAAPIDGNAKPKKSKKSARKILRDIRQMPDVEDEDVSSAHIAILSKFKKHLALARQISRSPSPEAVEGEEEEPQQEQAEASELKPLPQPAVVEDARTNANLGLPVYLSQPTVVSSSERKGFNSFGLNSTLAKRLADKGLAEAFAVQCAVIPLLLHKYGHRSLVEDVLVSASTGSGKTLAYLLPIIDSLSTRVIPALRAVIVVPTRELVTQVRETAESLAAGSGLRIGTATGTKIFAAEGELLVGNSSSTNTQARYGVDILIATPGRLVDHIRKTPGFNLTSLRWLVVDEADRLLGQSFQEWVNVVIAALEKPAPDMHGSTRTINGATVDFGSFGFKMPLNAGEDVRKVILSATMTRDVGKLASLKLKRPRLVLIDEEGKSKADGDEEVGEMHSLPPTLSEKYVAVEDSMKKPLSLRSLLRERDMRKGVLVFAKSNEGAARLGRLLELMNSELFNISIAVCNGEMRKKDAMSNVKKFKRGDVDVLICTDLISRGMDISTASYVVNYDVPRSVRDYVHRVGRTARAGKQGEAWSLVERNEARWFWKGIGTEVKRNGEVKRETVGDATEDDTEAYETALRKLGEEVRGQ